MKKKICIVTGSRAEYGLFYPLLKHLKAERRCKLQIVACGMHLSSEFGLTYKGIEKDGFKIDEKLKMPVVDHTKKGITKSTGYGVMGFADIFDKLSPDIVILLGDRFETFSAAIAAFINRIPIAHIHGGELTKGSLDDALRHSITKMSYLHFASTERYRKRIIQLGESPDRVFNVGAPGIDNIKNLNLMDRDDLEKKINFKFGRKTALVTFHPATLEYKTAKLQIKELLQAIDTFGDLKVIFTRPNADVDSNIIIELIDDYAKRHHGKAISFISLGNLKYLSTVKCVDVVIGNSSSGVIEVPSLGKPTVNIGDRQDGRIKAKSVIDCKPRAVDIRRAIKKALSKDFQHHCMLVKNPYGDGNAAEKIVKIIRRYLDKEIALKKTFYDIR